MSESTRCHTILGIRSTHSNTHTTHHATPRNSAKTARNRGFSFPAPPPLLLSRPASHDVINILFHNTQITHHEPQFPKVFLVPDGLEHEGEGEDAGSEKRDREGRHHRFIPGGGWGGHQPCLEWQYRLVCVCVCVCCRTQYKLKAIHFSHTSSSCY